MENLFIDKHEKYYLAEIGKWSKVIGIFCVTAIAFMTVLAIGFCVVAPYMDSGDPAFMSTNAYFLGVSYLLCAVFYFFPTRYILKSSKLLRKAVASNDQNAFTEGLKNWKSLMKFSAICCYIALGVIVIGVIAVIGVVCFSVYMAGI